MSYGQADAYADIQTLQSFWNVDYAGNSYSDFPPAIAAMQRLIYQASFDPVIKLIVASQGIFTDALMLEPAAIDASQWAIYQTGDGAEPHPPRWYLLDGIRKAIEPSFFSFGKGDPTGIAGWISAVDPAGAALAKAIAQDLTGPSDQHFGVDVRLAALQLVKSSALPISWVHPLLGAIDAAQTATAASALDQASRTALNVLTSEARSAVQLAANQAAQSTNFQALTGGGQEIQMGDPPPRSLALPWYKRIELWGALVGGLFGGVKLFERRSR